MNTLNSTFTRLAHVAGIALVSIALLFWGLSVSVIAAYWESASMFLWGG